MRVILLTVMFFAYGAAVVELIEFLLTLEGAQQYLIGFAAFVAFGTACLACALILHYVKALAGRVTSA